MPRKVLRCNDALEVEQPLSPMLWSLSFRALI
jgi:hypothetical protein